MKSLLICTLVFGLFFTGKEFKDSRDGRHYEFVEMNGLLWMAEDLKLLTPGAWQTRKGFHKKAPDTRFYPFHERDSLCPPGWHLLKESEWRALFHSRYDTSEYMVHSLFGEHDHAYQYELKSEEADLFKDLAQLNLHEVGWIQGERLRNRKAHHYWIDSEITEDPKHHIHVGRSGFVSHTHDFNITDENPKNNRRFAVRCVCDSISP